MKPALILHPGLAKCATSSIQQLFVMRDHALPRALGCVWIGRRFRPFNGHPPVSDIMYSPETCLADIAALTPDPSQVHLLSSEALIPGSPVVQALQAKFALGRAVVTIRFPVLQALSNYCFSGWMTRSLAEALAANPGGVRDAQDRFARTLTVWAERATPDLHLCPIEAPELEQRFCQTALGQAPALIGPLVARRGITNRSVSPALASALNRVMTARALPAQGRFRAVLAEAAKSGTEPEDFATVLPEDLRILLADRAFLDTECDRYAALLARWHTPPGVVAETLAAVRRRLDTLHRKPAPSPALQAALDHHATQIIDGIPLT